jgi:hypothetical protein
MPATSRPSLHDAIHSLLSNNDSGLQILGVSGPGGIGKSWAVATALREFDLARNGIIRIALDAADQALLAQPVEFVARYLTPPQLPQPASLAVDNFPRTRAVLQAFRSVCEQASRDHRISSLVQAGHGFVRPLIDVGVWLNDLAPRTRDRVDMRSIRADEQAAYASLMTILHGYRQARSLWPWNRTANAVRRDLTSTMGEAIALDFKALVDGFTLTDPHTYTTMTASPVHGCTKVLLILDDYEMLHQAMGGLLLNAVLTAFRDYQLPIRVIILGRDDIAAMDVRFTQHFGRHILGQHRLGVMPEEEALLLLAAAGYDPAEARTIHAEAGGYPYIIGHYLEHGKEAVSSALGAKTLYDRTVKWMDEEQRSWLAIVVRLDVVSLSSLRATGLSEAEAGRIMAWFESEPSLRDPVSPMFTVNRLLRPHLCRYLDVRHGEPRAVGGTP